MSENLIIDTNKNKKEQYELLLPQIEALTNGEQDVIANLSNISAALHQTFGWFWVGFYLVKNDDLVLGPFQGTIACTRIRFGNGVCGAAWEQRQSMLVPDVDKFPGHIACSSLTVSEIVIPVFNIQSEVVATLDIDSDKFDILDEVDVFYLEKLAKHIGCVIMR
ncbi:MAG: GAF domain-containing protein [Paludibacter sp.]